MINGRLSKFKDQLMEVKTNKEYTAMLKEIEAAQTELRRLEDRLLERMLEADDLAARQKDAEAGLADDKGIDRRRAGAARRRDGPAGAGAGRGGRAAREVVGRDLARGLLSTYETVRAAARQRRWRRSRAATAAPATSGCGRRPPTNCSGRRRCSSARAASASSTTARSRRPTPAAGAGA